MSAPPLVSILIPAYNGQELIAETIQSAIAQTWPRKEIIVVDDGSRDRTLAIARSFESTNIKVVTQANQGAATARNKAYSLSQGDFIQWLDADDLLSPDKIERQMQVAEQMASKRVLLSSGWVHFHYRTKPVSPKPTALWNDLPPVDWLVCKMRHNLHMQTSTWLTSRELSVDAGPWDETLISDDDGEYFCRVLLASKGVKFVPGAMTYYRMAGFQSLSRLGTSRRKLEAMLLSMRLHIRYLLSLEDSPRTRSACLNYIDNWHINFLPNQYNFVSQLNQLAVELGGELSEPRLSWKYKWLRQLFGWRAARQAQLLLPRIRWTGAIQLDKMLHRLERALPPWQRV